MEISKLQCLHLLQAAACTLLILAHLTNAELQNYVNHACSNNGSYTSNSTYSANLRTLLATISSNKDITYGFYNFSQGQDPDKVNAAGLCRGDVSLASCRSCIAFSTSDILSRCPTSKEAIIWYDHCQLRYSNRSIFGTFSGTYYSSRWVENVGDTQNKHLYPLLYSLRDQAAAGNSTRKFAVGQSNTTDYGVIYGLVQCTPDLSYRLCGDCLDLTFLTIDRYIAGNLRGSCYGPGCGFRYSLERFYEIPADATPPPPPFSIDPPQVMRGNEVNKAIIFAMAAAALCFLTLVGSICIFFRWRFHRQKKHQEDVEDVRARKSLQYDLSTIRLATGDFSEERKLGQGGFGSVYKGELEDGQLIAVKRLATGSRQGDAEFKNEVMLVAKLRHRNLVQLLGFCLEGSERLLMYEFMPNTSLDQLLFDACKRAYLDWERRYKIIQGIARGLLYLHEDSRLRIIHRDLKASNVLLDQEMLPKIADFGTARLFGMDETRGLTSHIVGTFGYMAPEYVMRGQFSTKSDVYSFGILVLELMSGQRKADFFIGGKAEDLITYGWESWNAGKVAEMVDQTMSKWPEDEMRRCLQIGLLCVQESASARPTMASVVLMLNSSLLSLPLPPKPLLSPYNSSISGMPASETEKSYNEGASIHLLGTVPQSFSNDVL